MSKPDKIKSKRKYPFWYYLVIFFIPVIFFILLEISLRIFNYGRDNNEWIRVTETKQMLNPEIAERYFFNTKGLPQSNNESFDIVKRGNSFRVFVMGGSSAAGFPFSPNGTFSRFLHDRLELLYPNSYIEIINIAITATNSYTIRDLLPEVINQNPNLIIIYAGHNEYYGALGVGSNENIGNSRSLVNFLIWINKFKSVELIRNVLNSFGSLFKDEMNSKDQQGETLMARIVKDKLIPYYSDSFNDGLNQFKGNLDDILSLTKEANIPVIIGTLVSNLKDQKPFISLTNSRFEPADTIFKRARIQLERNNLKAADSLFRYAKDLDALRFRAPEKINSIIKNLAKKYSNALVNIDSILSVNSPDGIVGNNLIVDHLHPSLKGYFSMSKIYFEAIKKSKLLPSGNPEEISDSQLDSLVLNNFAFTRLDSSIADIRLKGLLNDWPFVEKADFSFLKRMNPKDKIDSIAYKVSVENFNWERAHRDAAEYYLSKKDYLNFAKEFTVLISQYPFKISDYEFAASQLIKAKEYDLANNFLLKEYRELPNAFSTKWLGNIYLSKNSIRDAIKFFQESILYNKNDAQVFYNLAVAFTKNNDYSEAFSAIENCLRINPNFPSAKNLESQLTTILNQ